MQLSIAEYKEQIAELQEQNKQLEQDKAMAVKTSEIELRTAVLKVKEECQARIEKATEEHTAKLNEYIKHIEQLQSKTVENSQE